VEVIVDFEVDAFADLLDDWVGNSVVVERSEADAVADGGARYCVLHGELRFEARVRVGVVERVGRALGDPDLDSLDLLGIYVVVVDERGGGGDTGVREVTAGIVFDVDAVFLECPDLGIEREVVADVRTVEVPESAVAANGGRVGGEPLVGEASGSDAGTRAETSVEGFCHRSEVAFEASGRGRGDVERVHGFVSCEVEEGGGGGGRSERAERGGRVPAVLVVVGADGCGKRAFEFEASGERGDEVASRRVGLGGERENRGDQCDTGVTVHRPREVVVIERMACGTGVERTLRCWSFGAETEDSGGVVGSDVVGSEGGLAGAVMRAGERDADGVEERALDGVTGVGRDFVVVETGDELAERRLGGGHG